MWNQLVLLDKQLFLILNTWCANPFVDTLFVFITTQKNWVVPAIGGAILFIIRRRRTAVIVLLLGVVTVAITDPLASQVIKPLVGRLRPCHPAALVEGGHFLLGYKRAFSFPSNHAANMFGLAMVLTLFYPRKAVWFVAGAALVGYSRIHTGVHYPGDVAGGAILGIVIATAVFAVYRGALRFVPKKKSAVSDNHLGEPVVVVQTVSPVSPTEEIRAKTSSVVSEP